MNPIFWFTKQISRILHRLPKPPHHGINRSYSHVSQLMRNITVQEAKILYVGSLRETDYKYFSPYFKLICINLEKDKDINVICDAHWLPFKSSVFDGAILQAVLTHVKDAPRVIKETHNTMRAGGAIYISTPFLIEYNPAPEEYVRYTHIGVRQLLSNFREIELGVAAGPFVAIFLIIQSIAKNLSPDRDFNFVVWYIGTWVFYPLNWLDGFIHNKRSMLASSAAIYYVGVK